MLSETIDIQPFPSELPGIDVYTGLKRVGGDKEIYINMLNEFIDDYSGVVAEIRNAVIEGDTKTAHQTAHTFKGVAGVFCCRGLLPPIVQMEKAFKDNGISYEKVLPFIDTVQSKMDEVIVSIKELNEIYNSVSNECEESDRKDACLDVLEMLSMLKKLNELLQKNNPEAEIVYRAMHSKIPPEYYSEQYDELNTCIRHFDFRQACRTIESIIKEIKEKNKCEKLREPIGKKQSMA